MDLVLLQKTYRRYASHYDYLFGPILHPGRKHTVSLANRAPHQKILEVGVGTGLSLPFYRADSQVTGIDISPDMLHKARERVAENSLTHVEALLEMNAEQLDFPDASFDTVVAMYVASVVPNPRHMLDEMKRVCRPGGDIIIVNHFASKHPFLRRLERMLRPLSVILGFRPDMELATLSGCPGLEQIEIVNTNLLGYWKLIHYRKASD